MQAIGYQEPLPIDAAASLQALDLPEPIAQGRDLLVQIKGVSVNPVDCKIRSNRPPLNDHSQVLGWDAAGIISAVGPQVQFFKPGDKVWYAGDITRQGSNAELQLVDERIVGTMPRSLDFAQAAALPLTSITAWEILFDSFALSENAGQGQSLLIVGAAGGVGSILIQLAKKLTRLTVIATASRPQSQAWVKKMGADHVLDHNQDLIQQTKDLKLQPRYVALLTGSDQHYPAIVDLIQARGTIALIEDPKTLDIKLGKPKSLTLSWEFMFARSMFQTDDIEKQHDLLNRVATLVDSGAVVSTATHNLGPLSVASLKKAHKQQESRGMIGKIVLEGF